MKLRVCLVVLLLPLAAAAVPDFPVGEAWAYLIAQCEMGPRNPGSPGHEACRHWLVERLEGWGYSVEQHEFSLPDPYSPDTLRLTNIRASLPGNSAAPLLLGAHWDTRPRADRDPDPARRGEPIVGANDGASGVAVLLALARVCSQTPPPAPVEFIFFDGEDYGRAGQTGHYLLGSRRFVRDHPDYKPRLLILLDLVGGRDLSLPMELYSMEGAFEELRVLYELAGELDLPAFEPRPGHRVLDDHVPFLEAGIPAVDLVDMDYPQWHQHDDLPDACSRSSLAQLGTLILHYLYE